MMYFVDGLSTPIVVLGKYLSHRKTTKVKDLEALNTTNDRHAIDLRCKDSLEKRTTDDSPGGRTV